jgi:Na+-driven multidrug efflux pump
MVQIFNPNPELTGEASKALFVLTVTLPVAGCQLLMSGFFQHIGIAVKSAVLSVIRLAFFIPLIYLLPLHWGVNGVWATLPVSETLVCLSTCLIFYFQKKQLDRQ